MKFTFLRGGFYIYSLKKQLTFCFNQSETLPRSERPRHVISMEFLWRFLGRHFTRKTVGSVGKCQLFSQAYKFKKIQCILALINDKGIAKILYGGSLCNVEIHAVKCFGFEASSERGTSMQNSCVDDSHSKREQIILFCLFQSHCGLYKNCWWKYFDTRTKPFSTKWAFKWWLVEREQHRGKKKCERFCYSLFFLPIQGQQPSQRAPLEQGLINIYK